MRMEISRETRLLALLGYPLGHSFSPAMQNAAFEAAGINGVYIPVEVKAEDLGDVLRGMAKMNFLGCNVTIPHKTAVMEHLDELDPAARTVGAVNVIVFREGRAIGYNVDGAGFYRSFVEELGETAQGKTVFVLGAGGASGAICAVLALEGARRIYICNRTGSKAEALAARINGALRDCCAPVPWEYGAMEQALRASDTLGTTPSVGMAPHGDALCLDAGLLDAAAHPAGARDAPTPGGGVRSAQSGLLVCDIVYNPVKTRLLAEAEKRGCRTLSGLAMLAGQGEASFELWTGRKPPEGVMRAALERIVTARP
jgi:shikimate dehydrogenase